MLMRVICDTCQHAVNRFSAISAHRSSSRFVVNLLTSPRESVTSNILKFSLVIFRAEDKVVLGCTFFIIFIFDALRNLNDHKHF